MLSMRISINTYFALIYAVASILMTGGCNADSGRARENITQSFSNESSPADEPQLDDYIWDTYSTPDLELLQLKGFVRNVEMKLGCSGLSGGGFTMWIELDKGGAISDIEIRVGEGERIRGEVFHDASGRVSEMTFNSADGECSVNISYGYADVKLHRVEIAYMCGEFSRETSYLMVYNDKDTVPSGARFSTNDECGGNECNGVGQLAFKYAPDAAFGWNMCMIEGIGNMNDTRAGEGDSIPNEVCQVDKPIKIAVSREISYYSRHEIDLKTIKMMNGW